MNSSEEQIPPDEVRLETDGRWLVLPIHENVDIDVWARGLVKEALRAREVQLVKGARKVYADMYAELLTGLRATAEEPDLKLMMAYCYVPDSNLLYAAMAKMVIIVLPELSTLDDAVASLVAPAGANYGDARIEELTTASGPCVRVQQLLLDPETGGDSGVTSSLAYLWKTQQDGVFLVLACTFASPVEGALHEPAMDELASTLRKGARV